MCHCAKCNKKLKYSFMVVTVYLAGCICNWRFETKLLEFCSKSKAVVYFFDSTEIPLLMFVEDMKTLDWQKLLLRVLVPNSEQHLFINFLGSIISRIATCKCSMFLLVSVA